MNPRPLLLALAAAVALGAPAQADVATATPAAWNTSAQSPTGWNVVNIVSEYGEGRVYYARIEDIDLPAGAKIPLYSLNPNKIPEITLPTFESRQSAYYLKKSPTGNYVFTTHREGSDLNTPAVLVVQTQTPRTYRTLAAVLWDKKNPPEPGKRSTYDPSKPSFGSDAKIVIAAPIPMEPSPAGPLARFSDSSAVRNASTLTSGEANDYGVYFKRIHPMQIILGGIDPALNCYVAYETYPESCGAKFKEAYDKSNDGIHKDAIDLAIEGRKAGVKRANQIIGAPGSKTEFSSDELNTLLSLFQLTEDPKDRKKARGIFYQRTAAAVKKGPEALAGFVGHWRALVKDCYTFFIEDAATTDRGELNYKYAVEELRERIVETFDASDPVTAPAVTAPTVASPAGAVIGLLDFQSDLQSVIDKATSASEWYAFTANAEGPTPNSLGAPYASGKVYCRIGPLGANPGATLKHLGNQHFECVSLKQPEPAPVHEIVVVTLRAQVADAGRASFVQPPPASVREGKMIFISESSKTKPSIRLVLSDGRPMALGLLGMFHPTRNAPVDAAGEAGPTGKPTPPGAAASDPKNLTEAEKALLAPDELTKYNGLLKAASQTGAGPEIKAELAKMNAEYRALTKGRKPYAQPKDAGEFAKLEDWQKKRFCEGLPGATLIAGDKKTDFVGTDKGAVADAAANASTPADAPPPPSDPGAGAWNKDEAAAACAAFKKSLALTAGNTTPSGKPPVTANPPPSPSAKPPGDGKEKEAKKPSKWLTPDVLLGGAKGALIGLLIGSLFPPIGFIAGPLIGAVAGAVLTKFAGG